MSTLAARPHRAQRRAWLCATGALACAGALPAVAQATTVSRINSEGGVTIFVQDATGVDDNLSVLRQGDDTIIVNSPSLQITAAAGTTGSDCVQTTPFSVKCPVAPNLLAELGDGADQLSDGTSLFATVNGGPGADRLTSGLGVSNTNGGPGNDVLSSGSNVSNVGGASNFGGDDGNDTIDLSSRTATGDIARGGAGSDTVTYARRAEAVLVTLDGTANDGGSGGAEDDNVGSDVENVTGTGANDLITGSAGANTLRGGPGNDLLAGAAGDDTLLGDAGDDIEDGGDGDDRLGATGSFRAAVPATEDVGADSFRGGDGTDQLFTADGIADRRIDCGPPTPVEFGLEKAAIDLPDPQPVACEDVDRAPKDQHPTVQVRGGTIKVTAGLIVQVRLSCPRQAPRKSCRGVATLVKGKRTLARAKYSIARGKNRRVALKLSKPARGAALIRTAERDAQGRPEETLTPVVLRG